VVDPRINWRNSDWVLANPAVADNTLGDTNSISIPILAANEDGDIYIANAPITNVGELGFIALGGDVNPLPWESVDLVGTNSAVLDVFTVHTNEYEYGLVNANSADREVLASAIYGARQENYPGDLAAVAVNWPRAQFVGANITNYTATAFLGKKSELALVSAFTNGSATGSTPVTENQKESLLRGCADMIDTRSNTHTVVLVVRPVRDRTTLTDNDANGIYDGEDVDIALGEQIAVAQVWRDPVSKESQVTFLKWVARSE
jgi:hypothetical protein